MSELPDSIINQTLYAVNKPLINVDFAERYYAVRVPAAIIDTNSLAFETNKKTQKSSSELAGENHVAYGVKIGTHLNIEDSIRTCVRRSLSWLPKLNLVDFL